METELGLKEIKMGKGGKIYGNSSRDRNALTVHVEKVGRMPESSRRLRRVSHKAVAGDSSMGEGYV